MTEEDALEIAAITSSRRGDSPVPDHIQHGVDGQVTTLSYPWSLRARHQTPGGLGRAMRVAFLLGFLLMVMACAPENSAETLEVDPNRGAELYRQQCQSCHGGPTGGSATDFPPPHNAQGHTWHHGDCEVIRWTLEGKPSFGATGTTMPAFGDRLSEEDVLDILAHIRTWWTEEQREAQARVTEGLCE